LAVGYLDKHLNMQSWTWSQYEYHKRAAKFLLSS